MKEWAKIKNKRTGELYLLGKYNKKWDDYNFHRINGNIIGSIFIDDLLEFYTTDIDEEEII